MTTIDLDPTTHAPAGSYMAKKQQQRAMSGTYAQLPIEELFARIDSAKKTLGDQLVILGHHYQRDDVIRFADFTGDSLKLAKDGAAAQARYIVLCGVHFMAESAAILGRADQAVILPDLAAGCSMADMADLWQIEEAWRDLNSVLDADAEVLPITYVNSAANIKSFVGQHGGACCTSSNAEQVVRWAYSQRPKLFFAPDQHLGRYVCARKLDIPLDEMIVWDPEERLGGHTPEAIRRARVILWKGHCSVHAQFRPEHVAMWRQRIPGIRVIAHPECELPVVDAADDAGSTAYIIKQVEASEPGSAWAIGTEVNLVSRLQAQHPDKTIVSLAPFACLCSTMYRIDPEELCWALESLVEGQVVNQITVPEDVTHWARVALDRMLKI
jgi:quinolinate synthase